MTQIKLEGMRVDQLVELFTAIVLQQDKALLSNDLAKFNQLFDRMEEVKQELTMRPGGQRRALTMLYTHPNAQVRLKAAKATLAIAPGAARRVIQAIADSREYPQAGEAGMSLWNLDRGVFKPT
jgi:Domain of unknown function (DUF2019)